MIKYPLLRQQLFHTIGALADREYQRKAWVEKDFPPPIKYDCFDYAVHFLYDDTTLADSTEDALGSILASHDEVKAMRRLIAALEKVFAQTGTDATDEEYINSSEWDDVVEAAQAALRILNRNPHLGK